MEVKIRQYEVSPRVKLAVMECIEERVPLCRCKKCYGECVLPMGMFDVCVVCRAGQHLGRARVNLRRLGIE